MSIATLPHAVRCVIVSVPCVEVLPCKVSQVKHKVHVPITIMGDLKPMLLIESDHVMPGHSRF